MILAFLFVVKYKGVLDWHFNNKINNIMIKERKCSYLREMQTAEIQGDI